MDIENNNQSLDRLYLEKKLHDLSSNLSEKAIELHNITEQLKSLIQTEEKEQIDSIVAFTEKVINTTIVTSCGYYNILPDDLKYGGNNVDYVKNRQIIVYVLKYVYLKHMTLSSLGDIIGKNHATVLHAFKKIEKAKDTKDSLWYDFLNINESISIKLANQ